MRWLCVLACAAALAACQDSADSFFSGRPSGMAMAHNKVLDGAVESMVAMLRVPARFPGATIAHQLNWQESPIAWWGAPNGRERMLAAASRLSPSEAQQLDNWLAAGDASRTAKKRATLDEIRKDMSAIRR